MIPKDIAETMAFMKSQEKPRARGYDPLTGEGDSSYAIEKLKARVKELEETLRPFARVADFLDVSQPDDMILIHGAEITAGDVRRASETLKG